MKLNVNRIILKAVPYLAPLPTAYVIFLRLQSELTWDWRIALLSAVMIELVGFRAIGLAVDMRQFNRTLNAAEKQAKIGSPFGQALAVVILYALAVFSLTILLEIMPVIALWTPVAFLAIGITGGWLTALSNDFDELQDARKTSRENIRKQLEQARQNRKGKNGKQGQQHEGLAPASDKQEEQVAPASLDKLHPQVAPLARKGDKQGSKQPVQDEALLAIWGDKPTASDRQVAEQFGTSRQAIQQRREKLVKQGAIRMTDKGVEIIGIEVSMQPVQEQS
jgi:hypothetical protein